MKLSLKCQNCGYEYQAVLVVDSLVAEHLGNFPDHKLTVAPAAKPLADERLEMWRAGD